MDYQSFLAARRQRIADVVRAGFESLGQPAVGDDAEAVTTGPDSPALRTPLSATERVLGLIDKDSGVILSELLQEPLMTSQELRAEVMGQMAKLEALKDFHENLDLDTARVVADRCGHLMGTVFEDGPEEERRLVQAAALYFVVDEDAESDFHSQHGFDDDLAVVEAVETVLATLARADGRRSAPS